MFHFSFRHKVPEDQSRLPEERCDSLQIKVASLVFPLVRFYHLAVYHVTISDHAHHLCERCMALCVADIRSSKLSTPLQTHSCDSVNKKLIYSKIVLDCTLCKSITDKSVGNKKSIINNKRERLN